MAFTRIAGHRVQISDGVLEKHRAEMEEKAKVSETAIAPITVTDDQLALVKRTVAQGATDEELRLFLFDCKRQGVHPLDKLLHFTKRDGKYTPITSIDLMRTRAAEAGECAGIDDAVFSEAPLTATVTVWRLTQGQRYPYTATARWSEYYPGERLGFMWRKMPHTMLGKCAEALALRKAFPKQLAGLYAAEEMHQADREEASRRPITKAQSPRSVSPPSGDVAAAEEPEPTVDALFPDPEQEERNTVLGEIFRITKILKLSQKEREAYKLEFLGAADGDVMNADLAGLTAMLDDMKKRAGAA